MYSAKLQSSQDWSRDPCSCAEHLADERDNPDATYFVTTARFVSH